MHTIGGLVTGVPTCALPISLSWLDCCGDRRAYHADDVAVGAPGGATPMTLMIILGGIAALYLTGLLFRLAFLALPVCLGLCAFLLLRDQGNGWAAALAMGLLTDIGFNLRSEKRRVGKVWVGTVISGGALFT